MRQRIEGALARLKGDRAVLRQSEEQLTATRLFAPATGIIRDRIPEPGDMAFPQTAVLTLANPLRYFMVILRGVFPEGSAMHLFWPQYWPMGITGVITLALAGACFAAACPDDLSVSYSKSTGVNPHLYIPLLSYKFLSLRA